MTHFELVSGIIIPLLAAIIGRSLTLFGVIITIRWQMKKETENKIVSTKPWVFSVDKAEYDRLEYNKQYIMLLSDPNDINNMDLSFYLKNTDNGIGIIQRFETQNVTYFPYLNAVLDKNSVAKIQLNLSFSKKENLKDMNLYISDVYGRIYKYKVTLSPNKSITVKEITG